MRKEVEFFAARWTRCDVITVGCHELGLLDEPAVGHRVNGRGLLQHQEVLQLQLQVLLLLLQGQL